MLITLLTACQGLWTFYKPISIQWVIWSVLGQPPSISQHIFPGTNFRLGCHGSPGHFVFQTTLMWFWMHDLVVMPVDRWLCWSTMLSWFLQLSETDRTVAIDDAAVSANILNIHVLWIPRFLLVYRQLYHHGRKKLKSFSQTLGAFQFMTSPHVKGHTRVCCFVVVVVVLVFTYLELSWH